MRLDPHRPWDLEVLGSGTLLPELKARVARLPSPTAERIRLRGRVGPGDVATAMAGAGTFLMTSHPGYEGYARVLVESMASGLPAVVTRGSDTGGLVVDGRTGFTCDRSPTELAEAVIQALELDRSTVRDAVAGLNAPSLIGRILNDEPTPTKDER